jgi:L-amino acid N-acyltransferase YncA
MDFVLDDLRPGDWDQVRNVYGEGIATGHATFEAKAPAWEEWDAGHLQKPRLVARAGDCVVGWAALSPVSGRCVYAGVAEVSLYVGAAYRGQGVGSALLAALIVASEEAGIWTLQGGIFPENAASLGLVKKHGFREVGRREHLGKMTYGDCAGTWRDVILVERRSSVTGIE